jgi:glutamate racemase
MTESPIGVFDSGIGGLSVLQALQAELPHEHFVYWADSGYAPYGEKGDLFVRQRSLAIAQHLIEHHHIKALVVACNTATAAAIHTLRAQHPHLPLIGVEPALKPAIALSQTKRIGVIGTKGTLSSEKFHRLLASLQDQADFVVQPCKGLALAIEQSTHAESATQESDQISALLGDYTRQMGRFGTAPGEMDTLVLGCTHYVFAENALRRWLGPDVQLVSTGEPVARQTRRLLEASAQLRSGPSPHAASARMRLMTNGELGALQAAAHRWLQLPHSACHKADPHV